MFELLVKQKRHRPGKWEISWFCVKTGRQVILTDRDGPGLSKEESKELVYLIRFGQHEGSYDE